MENKEIEMINCTVEQVTNDLSCLNENSRRAYVAVLIGRLEEMQFEIADSEE